MAKVTMELIKELREKTQVGMMDCKKALISADGDMERAIEILRKKGASVASKRSGHATDNGIIAGYVTPDHKIGALLEISCETDFAANTEDMKTFAKTVCEHISNTKEACMLTCDESYIKTLLDDLMAKISENIKLSQCTRFEPKENGFVNVYIHPGATLGTIIELDVTGLSEKNRNAIAQLSRDLCMQIAVTNPICIEPTQLDETTLEKERNLIREQLKEGGKPAEIIEKILVGKMNKYYEAVCLLNQKYIKQDKLTIEKHIKEIAKETGCKIKIKEYKRFMIGK
ncbi:translation elongation factor Ts [Candidatus Babeliales bacterium]|nr:translation elongation factor Ts [Candidatus Babeliales bacterium]